VISAAPEEVIQSALEGMVPKDHISGTRFEYGPSSGEIRSIVRVPADYDKVAVLEELRTRLLATFASSYFFRRPPCCLSKRWLPCCGLVQRHHPRAPCDCREPGGGCRGDVLFLAGRPVCELKRRTTVDVKSPDVTSKPDLRSLLNHLQHLTLELIKAENRVFLASAQCIPTDSAEVFREFNDSLALEERLREERQQVIADIRGRLTKR
jgi:hypothetical protein